MAEESRWTRLTVQLLEEMERQVKIRAETGEIPYMMQTANAEAVRKRFASMTPQERMAMLQRQGLDATMKMLGK